MMIDEAVSSAEVDRAAWQKFSVTEQNHKYFSISSLHFIHIINSLPGWSLDTKPSLHTDNHWWPTAVPTYLMSSFVLRVAILHTAKLENTI